MFLDKPFYGVSGVYPSLPGVHCVLSHITSLFIHVWEYIREHPVWQPILQSVRDLFHKLFPAQATDFTTVHASFIHNVLPYIADPPISCHLGWLSEEF